MVEINAPSLQKSRSGLMKPINSNLFQFEIPSFEKKMDNNSHLPDLTCWHDYRDDGTDTKLEENFIPSRLFHRMLNHIGKSMRYVGEIFESLIVRSWFSNLPGEFPIRLSFRSTGGVTERCDFSDTKKHPSIKKKHPFMRSISRKLLSKGRPSNFQSSSPNLNGIEYKKVNWSFFTKNLTYGLGSNRDQIYFINKQKSQLDVHSKNGTQLSQLNPSRRSIIDLYEIEAPENLTGRLPCNLDPIDHYKKLPQPQQDNRIYKPYSTNFSEIPYRIGEISLLLNSAEYGFDDEKRKFIVPPLEPFPHSGQIRQIIFSKPATTRQSGTVEMIDIFQSSPRDLECIRALDSV